jgi:hypothetical protein
VIPKSRFLTFSEKGELRRVAVGALEAVRGDVAPAEVLHADQLALLDDAPEADRATVVKDPAVGGPGRDTPIA